MTRTLVAILVAMPLAVACERTEVPDSEPEPAPAKTESAIRFTDASEESGLTFTHFTAATDARFFPEITGAGAALLDYDSDGDLDVYLLQGSVINPAWELLPGLEAPDSNRSGNRLFRNDLQNGNLRFTDVTDESGLTYTGYGMGAAVGDFDNDGDPDLYATHFGSNVLYVNNGDGTFTDETRTRFADDANWSTSASFVDYDRDGDLDLFIANYVFADTDGVKRCQGISGRPDFCNPDSYTPLRDKLLRNDGDRFTDVTDSAGVALPGAGLGTIARDFNGDRWPDIYVANDGQANRLWINKQDGTFKDDALLAGCAYNAHGRPEASMGVTAGDFDADGDDDLFMTHISSETNTLFINNGKGTFIDATDRWRLGSASLSYTGWGTRWFDADNDGDLDIFAANGAVVTESSQAGRDPYPYKQPNQLFLLDGDRYIDMSAHAGPALELSEVSRGTAFGDIDNDGDIDILVANNNGKARLLLNESRNRHWLQIALSGRAPRDATGARVGIVDSSGNIRWRVAHVDGSYLSSNDPRVHFGLGDKPDVVEIRVRWPNGGEESFTPGGMDRLVAITQGSGQAP